MEDHTEKFLRFGEQYPYITDKCMTSGGEDILVI